MVSFERALQTNEGAGLGAVAMQHIRLQPPDQAHEMRPYQRVGRKRLAADREAMNAELQAWRDLRQRRFGAFAAGEAVGDDADVMAAIGLAVGEIEDVAEDSADRRAHRVQDTKRLICNRGHDQNQRSPTSTVSPGLRGVPSGTTIRIGPEASVWVSVTRSRRARGEKPPAMATALSTRHVGHVGILAGRRDFAEDEERPVGLDLHRDRGFADEAVAQLGGDVGGEARRRPAARRHRADQRHRDRAAGIDRIGIGETFLAIDHDPQPVAGIEPVGRVVSTGIGAWHRQQGAARNRGGARRSGAALRCGVAELRDSRRRCFVRLAVGHGIEIGLRLGRGDRRGPAHAARQSERSKQTENNGTRASHRKNP